MDKKRDGWKQAGKQRRKTKDRPETPTKGLWEVIKVIIVYHFLESSSHQEIIWLPCKENNLWWAYIVFSNFLSVQNVAVKYETKEIPVL